VAGVETAFVCELGQGLEVDRGGAEVRVEQNWDSAKSRVSGLGR
jgi:hypothetical protein